MRNKITYECTDKNAPDELVDVCPKNETYVSAFECTHNFYSIPVAKDGIFTAKLYIDGKLYKTIQTNF
jgi:hypothetical protein